MPYGILAEGDRVVTFSPHVVSVAADINEIQDQLKYAIGPQWCGHALSGAMAQAGWYYEYRNAGQYGIWALEDTGVTKCIRIPLQLESSCYLTSLHLVAWRTVASAGGSAKLYKQEIAIGAAAPTVVATLANPWNNAAATQIDVNIGAAMTYGWKYYVELVSPGGGAAATYAAVGGVFTVTSLGSPV